MIIDLARLTQLSIYLMLSIAYAINAKLARSLKYKKGSRQRALPQEGDIEMDERAYRREPKSRGFGDWLMDRSMESWLFFIAGFVLARIIF